MLRQKLGLKLFASSTKNDLVSKDFCLKAETHSDRRRSGYDNEHDTPFHNKSTWNPPNDRERALNTFLDAVKLDISTTKLKPTEDNLTVTERQAIRQLQLNNDKI